MSTASETVFKQAVKDIEANAHKRRLEQAMEAVRRAFKDVESSATLEESTVSNLENEVAKLEALLAAKNGGMVYLPEGFTITIKEAAN